jgi:TnpA family transposase
MAKLPEGCRDLRYIADEPLRRMTERQLNRGEARHALVR